MKKNTQPRSGESSSRAVHTCALVVAALLAITLPASGRSLTSMENNPRLPGRDMTANINPRLARTKPFVAPKRNGGAGSSIRFIENKGQITDQFHHARPDIDFKIAAGKGLNIFVGDGAIHYQFSKPENTTATQLPIHGPGKQHIQERQTLSMYRMDVELVGANLNAKTVTGPKEKYFETHYSATSGQQGQIAGSFSRVKYTNVYPHIDWVLYSSGGTLKHEFLVHPGGKVSDIKLRYSGATGLALNASGSLTAATPQGTINEAAPICYTGKGTKVKSVFVLDKDVLTYDIANYQGELIIDPSLEWATYFGGNAGDEATSVTTDSLGNVFITGNTESTSDLATTGAYQTTYSGSTDIFISKFDSSGTLLWCTYFGGDGEDYVKACASDGANIFIGGRSTSETGIATSDTYFDTSAGYGGGVFLAKFDSSGTRLWGTYYGNGPSFYPPPVAGMATDENGNVYFVTTSGSSVPDVVTTGAYKTVCDDVDALLVKFDGNGNRKWGTFYGGSLEDLGHDVCYDGNGGIYIVGRASSTSGIASSGAYQASRGSDPDIFLAKFDTAGNFYWGTYYGGEGIEDFAHVCSDGNGNIYLSCVTQSLTGIATAGAYIDSFDGEFCLAIAKFRNNGSCSWSTYYRGDIEYGSNDTYAEGIAAYGDKISITGRTTCGIGFATLDAYRYATGESAFLLILDSTCNRYYSTYYTTGTYGLSYDVVTDRYGFVYFTGTASASSGLASAGSHQETLNGASDAFLVKFDPNCVKPDPGTISGVDSVCYGATTTFSGSVAGGTWSAYQEADLTYYGSIDATGLYTTSGTGLMTVAHSVSDDGCVAVVTKNIEVLSPYPDAGASSGPSELCAGDTATLSFEYPGGYWISYDPGIATIDSFTGVITGVSTGWPGIYYFISSMCGENAGEYIINITSGADAGAVTGTANICPGDTRTLGSTVSGGVWSSSNTAVAIVGTDGVVSGLSNGTAVISYTVTSGSCVASATTIATVNATANAGSISGTAVVCTGNTTNLTDGAGGGVWSSTNTGIATVDGSGTVTGISPGTATISYTVSSTCDTAAATIVVTVNAAPGAGSVSGTLTVCEGATTMLTDAAGGGAWSSANTSVATIDGSGTVTGVTNGTSTISYTVTSSCGTAAATAVVTVNPAPDAGTVAGASSVTIGASISLSASVSGGTWSASNSNASVSSGGVVTGSSAGAVVISYTVTNSCGSDVATHNITVNSVSVGGITGTLSVCSGGSATLSNSTPGGSWSTANPSIALINPTTGVVSAGAAGTVTIGYTASGVTTTAELTVNPYPASITGTTGTCITGTTTLASGDAGGTWSSDNASVATVNSSTGVVTGVTSGSAYITYTLSTGCYRTKVVTVYPSPAAITGSTSLCEGSYTILHCTTGLSWTSSNTAVATVGSISGVVTGVSAGTTEITFTGATGCPTATVVTVLAQPDAITGTLSVCQGATTSLSSTTPGGTWSSSHAYRASVDGSGTVTGINSGNSWITYTAPNGCYDKVSVTVNPLPSLPAITGTGVVHVGSSVTIVPSISGGVWLSDNPARATVTPASGSSATLTGVSAGFVYISYTLTNSCGSRSRRRLFSVVTPRPGIAASEGGDDIISIYPNPSSGTFTIEAPVAGTLSVFATDGRIVGTYEVSAEGSSITLPANLTSGIYMCRFSSKDGRNVMIKLLLEH